LNVNRQHCSNIVAASLSQTVSKMLSHLILRYCVGNVNQAHTVLLAKCLLQMISSHLCIKLSLVQMHRIRILAMLNALELTSNFQLFAVRVQLQAAISRRVS